MCGRYQLEYRNGFEERFGITGQNPYRGMSRYNIAPGQTNPVITEEAPHTVSGMKWGLVPHWAKDEKIGYKMINARAETVAEKPSFKKLLEGNRCLVPATGFYEWKREDDFKQPYSFRRKDEEPFAMAGLYTSRKGVDGSVLYTYTVITTEANDLMRDVHHRMPVILSREEEHHWLDPDMVETEHVLSLLHPWNADEFEKYPVSTAVNVASNEGEHLVGPLNSA